MTNQMRKCGVYYMLLELVVSSIIALLLFAPGEVKFMNKLVVTIHKASHFNWTPLFSILFMALTELVLWEVKYNNNFIEFKTRLKNKCALRLSCFDVTIKQQTYRFLNNHNLYIHRTL